MSDQRDGRDRLPVDDAGAILNRQFHSKFGEHLQNLLSIPSHVRKEDGRKWRGNTNSKFVEPSRHLLGTMNKLKQRIEATD